MTNYIVKVAHKSISICIDFCILVSFLMGQIFLIAFQLKPLLDLVNT